ncbi:hypothetical protein F5Y17DRAFT_415497 [Xylariaceae sp. FL0594]|nr:hypothetical protein F5Y17DRAFT_415497 [Xylariaceae sp. FL0594]
MSVNYTLLDEGLHDVPQSWFDTQTSRHHQKTKDASLKSLHDEEVKTLKAYHDGQLTAEAAAAQITSPISGSPVPELGGYSDHATAIRQLWKLLTAALVEWPSSRTGELVSLLRAISEVGDPIHGGEVQGGGEGGKATRTWKSLPWFEMVWSEEHWMQPGQIARRATDDAHRRRLRDVYIKSQDVEAQLVAAGLLGWKRAFRYLIGALERKPGPDDRQDADNDGKGFRQLKLDFHIPAAARWIRHNGKRLHDGLARDELKDWDQKKEIPSTAQQFDQPLDRWTFWRERFAEIQREESDEFVKEAAGSAVDLMGDVHG